MFNVFAGPGDLQPYTPNAVGFRDDTSAYVSIGMGVGVYYLASRPEGVGNRDPAMNKTLVTAAKLVAAFGVHKGLRNFMTGNKALFTTVGGVLVAEWFLNKKPHADWR